MGRESPTGVRALPSVGGRTYSGLWEQFLERVWGRWGNCWGGSRTKCGRGSALWVIPLKCWRGGIPRAWRSSVSKEEGCAVYNL